METYYFANEFTSLEPYEELVDYFPPLRSKSKELATDFAQKLLDYCKPYVPPGEAKVGDTVYLVTREELLNEVKELSRIKDSALTRNGVFTLTSLAERYIDIRTYLITEETTVEEYLGV
jgi:hypothetical protein